MKFLIAVLVFLVSSLNAQVHNLDHYAELADALAPYPHDLYHYCETVYDGPNKPVEDGSYWVLVTDGYGSLEKYTAHVENNTVKQLSWKYPQEDSLVLTNTWLLHNGVYFYKEEDYFFIL